MASSYALANDTAAQRIKLLEERLQAFQMESEKVKFGSSRAVQKVNTIEQTTNQTLQKVNTIEQSNTAIKKTIEPIKEHVRMNVKSRKLFFRGGFTHMKERRDGSSIRSDVAPLGAQERSGENGRYAGAGIDWGLTRNLWGLMPKTTVFAELMFEYKQYGTAQGNALAVRISIVVYSIQENTVDEHTQTHSLDLVGSS